MTDPLVAAIAAFPDLAERLIHDHHGDGSGHCRACPIGAQRGFHVWPCSIYTVAVQARDVRHQRTTRRVPDPA